MAIERRYERFAFCIERRMRELNLLQKDLCLGTGISEDLMRKMRQGLGVPSGEKLDRLAVTLQMDPAQLRKLLLQDVGARDVARNMTALYPSLHALEEVWDELSPRQQEDLAKFAGYLARRNHQPDEPDNRSRLRNSRRTRKDAT